MKYSSIKNLKPIEVKTAAHPIFVYLLGTNGWYDTELGNTICTYIKHDNFNIIVDSGFGIQYLEKYCNFNNPSYLFLSHLHIDHICGLHLLAKFRFKKGLKIFVKKGLKSKLKRFLSKDYTVPINLLPYKCQIYELNDNSYPTNLPFKVVCASLKHSVPVLGYRFDINSKIISVIMDTGYCDNAVKLSRQADLLIAESSYLPGEENKNWPHLNPNLAKKLAFKAQAKKLILTHFAADKYLTAKQREL